MKPYTPTIYAWVYLVLALPTLFGLGGLFLLAGWGYCGDSPPELCDPSTSTILMIGGIQVLCVAAMIGLILPVVGNFLMASTMRNQPDSVVPTSYYVMTYSTLAVYVSAALYAATAYWVGDGAIFVPLGIAVVSLISSVWFLIFRNR